MNETLVSYVPFFLFLLFAVGLAAGMVGLSTFFGKRRGHAAVVDLTAYECGVPIHDPGHKRQTVQFYMVAMLFILFDLEVAFLYPWAVAYRSLGWFAFWAAMVFLGLLTVGFIYIWARGALDWKPTRRAITSAGGR
jgi:NADH-quinone oxidoreductase subunit A